MYLDYFSLNRHPFRITPDPSLFFPGGADGRGVILNALIYAITSGEGILKVVGEVGSGKTMICRMLEEQLPGNVEIVYIANPSLSAREILYAIAIELKLDVSASTERLKVLHLIQDYLLDKHGKGGTVVVFIEEAQSMPLETLEEIRLLSNLETHQHKLMQIVLFGQPELDRILAQKNIRQLRERITHSFRLEPLSAQATSDYIRYRLKVAGCPWPQLFSPRAEKLIAKASSGLTRRINILADKALLAAYADSPLRQPEQDSADPLVLPRHARAAIRDTDYHRSHVARWLAGGLGLAVLVLAGIFTVLYFADVPAGPGAGPVAATPGGTTMPAGGQTGDTGEAATPVNTQTVVGNGEAQETGAGTPAGITPGAGTIASVADETPQPAAGMLPDPGAQTPAAVPGGQGAVVATGNRPESGVAGEIAVATVNDGAGAPDLGETAVPPHLPAGPGEDARETTVDASGTVAVVEPVQMLESPVSILPAGLAELRMQPTADWLSGLPGKKGYTIVLFSVPSTNPNGLEEYLQFLQLVSMLGDTYICFMPVSSPVSGRWQVMYREFQGVTPARNLLREMPEYIKQYNPYLSNLDGIRCTYPVTLGY